MRSGTRVLQGMDRRDRNGVTARLCPPARPATAQRKGSAVDLQLGRKAALVTGAGPGIGRHLAEHPAAQSAAVAITARTAAPPEVTAQQSQVTCLASPRASVVSGARIPVDGAQRKAIMDW